MLNKSVWIVLGLAVPLGATPAAAQDVKAGAAIYRRCAVCHSTTGAISVGPPLNGVMNRAAGAVPRYTYSKTITSRSIVWDNATLDRFLTRPQAVAPGTKMGFAGMSNAKERQDLIAYLATLRK